ncbi:hypothetical protein [Elioraea thermophila]|uniref:hypothetical protein n=1 Tax=Elioraea thermophila TaxID=2185104 RepID=UPI000DF2C320|nr:hypothetical protein [Elioraea thermophila]
MRATIGAFVLLLTPVFLFVPLQAQAGAFAVDDATIGTPGEVSLDLVAGVSVNRARERVFAATPAYTLQAIPLQLSLEFAREGLARGDEGPKRRFWGTALAPEAKLRLLDLDAHGRIGLAVATGFSWRASLQRPGPTEDEDEVPRFRRLESISGLGITSFRLVERVTLNLNAGLERDRAEGRTQPLWGVGAAWVALPETPLGTTTLIAEASGTDRGRAALQAGLRQTLWDDRVDLDLVVGRNLSDERATWLVFGVAGRF